MNKKTIIYKCDVQSTKYFQLNYTFHLRFNELRNNILPHWEFQKTLNTAAILSLFITGLRWRRKKH